MRTRIALAAATATALSIGISSTVLLGDAAGAPTRATHAVQPARSARARVSGMAEASTTPGVFGRAATAYVPGGFLAPALSAVHRRDANRRARRDAWSLATLPALARTRGTEAHEVQMERVIDAWRAAHPAPPATPPAPAPSPAPAPAPVVVSDATSTTTPDWACIRLHESGDRFNTPSAPGGAYGFLESTWLSLGYSGWPYQAPPAVQDQAVLFLYNELGWQPWSTRAVCGL